MMTEMEILISAGEGLKPFKSCFGAGHDPARGRKLSHKFPIGRGPNVFGVCRTAPWKTKHQASIRGHGGRGVDEMSVQPSRIGGKLACEHRGLAEAADAIAGPVPGIVGEKHR